VVDIGRGSVLVVSPSLMQIVEPSALAGFGVEPERFGIIALKSRVHFRRGFVDSGFVENVVLVEPASPFLGTTRLEALPYEHLRLSDYYPFGRDEFEPAVVHGRGRRAARGHQPT
jgi:microcystin degradation protein MlrC